MILAVLGSLGGVVAFTYAVWTIVRAILRQADATHANTEALNRNTQTIEKLDKRVDQHDIEIAMLKSRRVR